MSSAASIDPITVTESAITKVYELMQEEGNPELKLRVYITGGGCSGFQYGFSFEEKTNPDDIVIEKSVTGYADADEDGKITEAVTDKALPVIEAPHIQLIVDMMSLPYLQGAEIDYLNNLQGEQFVIRGNPNAKTTCGCGSSFAVDEKN